MAKRLSQKNIGDLVRIAWHDAHSKDAWETESELDLQPALAISYGVVLRIDYGKDNPHILLAGDYFEADNEVGRSIAIPAGFIQDIRIVEKQAREIS